MFAGTNTLSPTFQISVGVRGVIWTHRAMVEVIFQIALEEESDMVKRISILALLMVLVVSAIGFAPTRATAAPDLAVKDAPNAALLPADTGLYADFRVGDLNKTLDFVGNVFEKVTGQKMPAVFESMDRDMTRALGRDASFAKDVQPWLGDHITAAIRVTDKQLAAIDAAFKDGTGKLDNVAMMPQYLVIVSVKNDAAASKFITEVLDAAKKQSPTMAMSTRTETVNGAPATIYDQGGLCETNCTSFVVAKGFLMVGQTLTINDTIAGYKAKTATLAADPNFVKMVGALKPVNLATFYLNPRLYSYFFAMSMARMSASPSSGLATPDATQPANPMMKSMEMLRSALNAVQGQAFGLRLENKVLAIDLAEGVDLKALAALYTQMGYPGDLLQNFSTQPIAFKLAKQIPAKAIAVVTSQGLGKLYTGLREGLKAAAKNNLADQFGGQYGGMQQFSKISEGLEKAEAYLKLAFDIDVNEDVLSWMNGEFATYMTYNQNSDLAKMGRQPWPFDHAILIDSGDVAKTKTFIDKVNAGLTKNNVTPTSKGDNLYLVTHDNGPSIGYGLVGNTFVLSTGSGLDAAVAAVKGDGVITSSPIWMNAQKNAINPTAQFWFVNLDQVQAVIKLLAPANELSRPDTVQFLKLLDQFESISLSSGVMGQDGMVTGSFQINIK